MTVGPAEALDVRRIVGRAPRWCGPEPSWPVSCLAQVRAHGEAVPAVAYAADDGVRVDLDVPLRAVAPGQAVVLYDEDCVLGSATIASTRA